jgi:beta-galactosidase
LRRYQASGPLMNSEYYTGWITHWGDKVMSQRTTESVVLGVERMLSLNASFNFYMFHGGSNFGYWNGANADNNDNPDLLDVTIQSYDYDAPLSEAGDLTPKYMSLRRTILSHTCRPPCAWPPLPYNSLKSAYGTIKFSGASSLWNVLPLVSDGSPVESRQPLSFEHLNPGGPAFGFVLYEFPFSNLVTPPAGETSLTFQEIHDFATIYVDRTFLNSVNREKSRPTVTLSIPKNVTPNSTLQILVESHGRVNFGPYLTDYKGMGNGIRFGIQFLFGWKQTKMSLSPLPELTFNESPASVTLPAFFSSTFTISTWAQGDTFLDFEGWTKGHVWINGFHLGRYWNIGPQKSIYIPSQLVRFGLNEIVILEVISPSPSLTVQLLDHPTNIL